MCCVLQEVLSSQFPISVNYSSHMYSCMGVGLTGLLSVGFEFSCQAPRYCRLSWFVVVWWWIELSALFG
jgi:hypothetical protein